MQDTIAIYCIKYSLCNMQYTINKYNILWWKTIQSEEYGAGYSDAAR